MITYKVLGACGVIACGLWFHCMRERYQNKKLGQLQAYIKLFAYVKNQIECYMLPMDKILIGCNKKILSDCGYTYPSVPRTIEEILNRSVIYMDDYIKEKIEAFAKGFGNGYLNEQIKQCEGFIGELRECYDNLKSERKVSQLSHFQMC